jgi:hypothetical protein
LSKKKRLNLVFNITLTGGLLLYLVIGGECMHSSIRNRDNKAGFQSKDSMGPRKWRLASGLICSVKGKVITIATANGKLLSANSTMIRARDEKGACPSEGFLDIVSKGEYFTVEQQNCAGWYFINEYFTFKYLPKSRKIVLHKLGFKYTDRRDPDKEIPVKLYNQKHFGTLYFEKVHVDSLYKYN